MKYINTYEKMNMKGYDPDPDKIYVYYYSHNGLPEIVGKMDGYMLDGISLENSESERIYISKFFWHNNVREATPIEIEKYELLKNSNKYNL